MDIRKPRLVAVSAEMRIVLEQVRAFAPFDDVPVLIGGESGTGKELVARMLHLASPRRSGPFVALNGAALPDSLVEAELFGHARGAFTGADRARRGLVEEADRGTLFLDEVADLSLRAQTILLRLLQEREFRRLGESSVRRSGFRLITASHKDLDGEVSQGRFRRDLYFRLKVARIEVPPLRERPADIVALARHFLSMKARSFGLAMPALSREVERALVAYPWPGNVRELENEMIQTLVRARGEVQLRAEHLSPQLRNNRGLGLRSASDAFERRFLVDALKRHRGNRTRTARELGLSRQGLYRKLKRHGLMAAGLAELRRDVR